MKGPAVLVGERGAVGPHWVWVQRPAPGDLLHQLLWSRGACLLSHSKGATAPSPLGLLWALGGSECEATLSVNDSVQVHVSPVWNTPFLLVSGPLDVEDSYLPYINELLMYFSVNYWQLNNNCHTISTHVFRSPIQLFQRESMTPVAVKANGAFRTSRPWWS